MEEKLTTVEETIEQVKAALEQVPAEKREAAGSLVLGVAMGMSVGGSKEAKGA